MQELKGKKTHVNQLDVGSAETAEAINGAYAFTVGTTTEASTDELTPVYVTADIKILTCQNVSFVEE
jgi:hypothetical protein